MIDDQPLVFSPEFVLIPLEYGIFIDGGRQPQILRGVLAISLLPLVMPLINGTRNCSEIVALMPGVPPEHTRELIEQLLYLGVVTSRNEETACPASMRDTLSALKRRDPRTDLRAAYSSLAEKRLLLVYDPSARLICDALAKALRDNGFQHIGVAESTCLEESFIDPDCLLVSLFNGNLDSEAAERHYLGMLARRASWLRTILDVGSNIAEAGPLFRPDTTLCKSCLTRPLPKKTGSPQSAQDCTMWSAVIATELTARLLGSVPVGPRSFRRYRMPLFESELKTWPSAKRCIFCSHDTSHIVASSRERERIVPYFFEEQISRRYEASDSVDQHENTVMPHVTARLMLNGARVFLPQTKVELRNSAINLLLSKQRFRSSRLNLTAIGCLLSLSVGFKPGSTKTPRRWVPSGGNLGSVEAYLIARQVEGISPGVYLYSADQHALVRLNQRGIDHVQAAVTAVCPGDSAPAFVVFTGSHSRIARKYGGFAYKLLHLDAGAACSQFLLVAAAMRVSSESISGWNPAALQQALVVREPYEVCTHVFRIASAPLTPIPARSARASNHSNVGLPVTSSDLQFLADFSTEALVETLMSDSSYVGERLPTCIRPSPMLRTLRLKRSIFLKRLAEATLGEVLNNRSSIRHFAKRAIRVKELRLMVQSALANNVTDGSPLTARVLVRAVEGLEPGVYVYHSPSASLQWERSVLPDNQIRQMFFQSPYEETPVIIWISGDVVQAAAAGEAGYQSLLVRAGVLGHRLWMAGLSLGLSGVLIAGITAEAATEYDELIPWNETSLIAFLCGYAPEGYAEQRPLYEDK